MSIRIRPPFAGEFLGRPEMPLLDGQWIVVMTYLVQHPAATVLFDTRARSVCAVNPLPAFVISRVQDHVTCALLESARMETAVAAAATIRIVASSTRIDSGSARSSEPRGTATSGLT